MVVVVVVKNSIVGWGVKPRVVPSPPKGVEHERVRDGQNDRERERERKSYRRISLCLFFLT
jgi:hypothetical protein